MRGKKRFFLGILAAAAMVAAPFCMGAGAQEATDKPCTPVAAIFDTKICLEEINPEQQHIEAIREQYEEQGLDSDEALRARNRERLGDILWDTALSHKFGKDALTPSEEELALYNTALRSSLDLSHKKNLQTAKQLHAALDAPDQYSKEQQGQMLALLESVEKSIAFYNQREEYKNKMPPEFHDMLNEAERGLAEKMMKEWKTNSALYREYGGRLGMVEGAVVPVDAVSAFLTWIEKDAKLTLYDKEYKDIFHDMRVRTQNPDKILPESDKDFYENYYSSPAWQFQNQ